MKEKNRELEVKALEILEKLQHQFLSYNAIKF